MKTQDICSTCGEYKGQLCHCKPMKTRKVDSKEVRCYDCDAIVNVPECNACATVKANEVLRNMKSQHTPTPWICTLHEEGDCNNTQHGGTYMHTPLPWKVTHKVFTGRYWIEASDETTVATILDPMNSQEVKANAAFVVRACNSHDELVSLIKDVGNWLEVHLELGHINAGTGNRDGDLVSQIRAAIAKAEGK